MTDDFRWRCWREEGGSLRPTLTLEPCTNAWTLVVSLRCRRSSVSRSRRWLRVLSATCQHYGQTPPVDPADHNERGGWLRLFGGGLLPNIAVLHSEILSVPVPVTLSLIGLPPFYGYPSRGLNHHCALSSLSPTTHTMGSNRLLRGGLCLKGGPT